MDPAEPIDKIDPAEPIDKIDPLEPMLRMDPSLFRMESFSQGPRFRQAMTVIPTGARSPRHIVGQRQSAAREPREGDYFLAEAAFATPVPAGIDPHEAGILQDYVLWPRTMRPMTRTQARHDSQS